MDPSDQTGSSGQSQSQAHSYRIDGPGYYYIPVKGFFVIPGSDPVQHHGPLQQVRFRDLLNQNPFGSDPPRSSQQQGIPHNPLNPNPLFGSGHNSIPGSDRPRLFGSSQQQCIPHNPLNPNPLFGSGHNSIPGSDRRRPRLFGSSQQQGICHVPKPDPLFGPGYKSVPGSVPLTFRGSSKQQGIHNPLKPNPPLGSNRPTLHGSSQQPKPFGWCYKSVPGSDLPTFGGSYQKQAPGTSKRQRLTPIDEQIPSSSTKQYCITVSEGEDIVSKIKSVSQQCPNLIYVVSASGSVFNPVLQPYSSHDSRGGIGKYDIQVMSISYPALNESFKLSVTLVGPKGHVIRGTIGGSFIAASPVQVIVGSCISESEVPKIQEEQQQEDKEEEEEEDYSSYFSSEPPRSL